MAIVKTGQSAYSWNLLQGSAVRSRGSRPKSLNVSDPSGNGEASLPLTLPLRETNRDYVGLQADAQRAEFGDQRECQTGSASLSPFPADFIVLQVILFLDQPLRSQLRSKPRRPDF